MCACMYMYFMLTEINTNGKKQKIHTCINIFYMYYLCKFLYHKCMYIIKALKVYLMQFLHYVNFCPSLGYSNLRRLFTLLSFKEKFLKKNIPV